MDIESYIEKYGLDAYNDHPSKKGKSRTKYSECTNQLLRSVWEALDDKLKEDFNIELKLEQRKSKKDRGYSVLGIYIENVYYGQIYASTFESTISISGDAYKELPDGTVRKCFKDYYNKRASSLRKNDSITQDEYLADVFGAVIDLINDVHENEALKLAFDKQQANNI